MRNPESRWLAATGAIVAVLVTPALAAGAGHTYEVVQCDPANRAVADISLEDAPAYAVRQGCGDQNDHAIKVKSTGFAHYERSGRVHWSTGSPSLGIVGAEVQARLRRNNGHVPRLWMADAGGHEVAKVAGGGGQPTGFRKYTWHSPGAHAAQFVASLRCWRRSGCKQSDVAKTWLRNIHLTVADYADPVLERVDGSLLKAGWLRGAQGMVA